MTCIGVYHLGSRSIRAWPLDSLVILPPTQIVWVTTKIHCLKGDCGQAIQWLMRMVFEVVRVIWNGFLIAA